MQYFWKKWKMTVFENICLQNNTVLLIVDYLFFCFFIIGHYGKVLRKRNEISHAITLTESGMLVTERISEKSKSAVDFASVGVSEENRNFYTKDSKRYARI